MSIREHHSKVAGIISQLFQRLWWFCSLVPPSGRPWFISIVSCSCFGCLPYPLDRWRLQGRPASRVILRIMFCLWLSSFLATSLDKWLHLGIDVQYYTAIWLFTVTIRPTAPARPAGRCGCIIFAFWLLLLVCYRSSCSKTNGCI